MNDLPSPEEYAALKRELERTKKENSSLSKALELKLTSDANPLALSTQSTDDTALPQDGEEADSADDCLGELDLLQAAAGTGGA
mmetsp:Transcript_53388/g.125008  ORF Transcript_53388/g.125008 Transcript_53388/m.125008 type:complete len:84 (+) Transcript_53388:176-427(+)